MHLYSARHNSLEWYSSKNVVQAHDFRNEILHVSFTFKNSHSSSV